MMKATWRDWVLNYYCVVWALRRAVPCLFNLEDAVKIMARFDTFLAI